MRAASAMSTETSPQSPRSRELLGDPALRAAVVAYVRRRVPPADIEDVVQTVLCDALDAPDRPESPEALKRWVLGIARHKVVDRHRTAGRERPADLPDLPAGPAPLEERSMVRWVERQATRKDDARTLTWLAREGEGEKLEAIAASEQLPAAQVRQRVSRMRRWMRERWAAELAAVAMLATILVAAWWLLRDRINPPVANPAPPPTIAPEPEVPALDRARNLRADGVRACDAGDYRTCLDDLDQARALDPEGDQDPVIAAVRAGAEAALRVEPESKTSPRKDTSDRKGPWAAPSGKPVPTSGPPETGKKARPSKKPSKSKESDPDLTGTPGGGATKPSPRMRTTPVGIDSEK
jgi:DNA-directed RNA polymerase specialized sigma24 family protein